MGYSDVVLASTPLAYWRLGEAAGPTFADTSGNGHALTAQAGVTFNQAGAIPDGNKAALFDGTTNARAATTSGVTAWSGGTALSLEAWVKNAAWAAATHEVAVSLGGVGHYLSCETGLLNCSIFLGSQVINRYDVATLSLNVWHHMVATWASGEPIRLYLDGAGPLVGTNNANQTGTLLAGTNIVVGMYNTTLLPTSGYIDEVAVYLRKLSTSEVAAHYLAGLQAVPANPTLAAMVAGARKEDALDAYNLWATVTPSDSVDLPRLTRGLWVGGAGTLAAVMQNNQMPVALTVPAGAWLPMAVRRVNSTGTTATAIVALYEE